ncbi:MAG: AAA family ATPase [bacterium]|nr:AAA family ATPase [bacterium]
MIIENLKLNNFRNLINSGFNFDPGTNLIHGMNGAGKTTILEAVFLSAFGKSFLNVKKADVLNDRADDFSISMKVKSAHGNNNIRGYFKGRLSLLLDDKKSNIIEVNKYLYPVFFSSANYQMYIESKTWSRKMIDRFVFGLDSLYIHHILSYNKALRQKNHLLKLKRNFDQLSSWNSILSDMSANIINRKTKFIERINSEIKGRFHPGLELRYSPAFETDPATGTVNKEYIFRHMEQSKQLEIQYGRTIAGPHLDMFEIFLDGKNLKFYSSGEKKINLLKVYITFIEIFREVKKEYPIFLVDDFDTAIDDSNIDFLVKSYPEMQVIATSVNSNDCFRRQIELVKEN